MAKKQPSPMQALEFLEEMQSQLKADISPLSKLVIQENLIALQSSGLHFFCNLLHAHALAAHEEVWSEDALGKELGFSRTLPSEGPAIGSALRKMTLGQICNTLQNSQIVSFTSGAEYIKQFKEFNKRRNKITHKMFTHFNDSSEVHALAEEALESGSAMNDIYHKLMERLAVAQKVVVLKVYKK